MPITRPTLDQITSLAKRRGFVFQTSEIYGGLASSYDYGPAGVELLRNIKNLWWKYFISSREDMVGLDSQILLHPKTWEASGHTTSFSDPLVEDEVTHKRYRADHLIQTWISANRNSQISVESMSTQEMGEFILTNNILSPDGNPVSKPKDFSLLFETSIGSVAGEKATAYLRGETAQGIFSNFKQVLDSSRVKLPFGVGQVGKSFRNEITTGQFVFRTLEFEQAEIEYFFDPNKSNWQELFENWKNNMWEFVTKSLGVNSENIKWRQHTDQERSFYSQETYDLDYNFPNGWSELWGIAYRTDYDLKQHMKFSGESLEYRDPDTNELIIPHVIEPAVGINRLFLMVLTESFYQDEEKNRLVLKLPPALAPYKAAVFPLVKNKPELVEKAKQVFNHLKTQHAIVWDERGNIGKRYLAQDEIGTPVCITIDYQSLEDQTVTVRNRDDASQQRVKIEQLEKYLQDMIG